MLSDDGADALAQKLKQLMADRELRIRMGKNTHEEMMKYAPEKIWNQWEQLLKNISSSEENRIH